MHIDDYGFGRIVIEGNTYTSGVIVYPEKVDPSWWRKEGHLLQKVDLHDVISAGPDVVVIGTGNWGVLKVPDSTISFLESKGIRVIVEKTAKAVEIFNEESKKAKTVGTFHLTC
jgi:hypothetical protein